MRSHFKVILKQIVCGSNFSDLRLYSFHVKSKKYYKIIVEVFSELE